MVGGKQGHVHCNVVEVKASGPPHVLILCLGVSKVMFPVKYLRYSKTFFVSVECQGDHNPVIKLG